MNTKVCMICKTTFNKRVTTSKKEWEKTLFCSRSCYYQSKLQKTETKICQQCERIFKIPANKTWMKVKFCSQECWHKNMQATGGWRKGKYNLMPEELVKACQVCGKPFQTTCLSQWLRNKYCSVECRVQGTLGQILQNRHYGRPNKAEQRLLNLMTENNLPFKYVGDGQFILGGKCPDFINVNGKKQVVELFGAYWHDIFDVAERKEHFRQYGFDTLFIWEDELKDMEKVTKKLVKFSKSSHGVENGKQMA